jgi:phosphopantothenoylcysteine decarboxylase/phosphopantothenate--cysteine ligase
VGFAAEHGADALERARGKLERKRLDLVVLNDISRSDIGFDSHENEVTIISAAGVLTVSRRSKDAVAAAVLDRVQELRVGGRSIAEKERS